ncbi:hypothetical protein TrRE_jg7765 [Triparma retinervis]|uniref:Uncharacterized protein n=1 Tax=Triparma retinervis TaxID=2557542 RepID=A0A9W7DZI9_9STRA|nr:hypothetical protein TrRE_jg7765 [Triparma retinervis]
MKYALILALFIPTILAWSSSITTRRKTALFGRAAAVRAQTKGKTDAKKTKIYGQFGKKIIMAVKDGGSASPEANKLLRDTIAAAKKNNVPADNIKRAIKRATDSADSAGFQSSLFEAYGAGGASFMISVLTDNSNRAAAEVKNAVNKAGKGKAKLAESGSVSYLYERKGRIVLGKGEADEEKVLDVCLEVGVEDFLFVSGEADGSGEDADVVYTEQGDLALLRDGLKEHAGVEAKEADLCYKSTAPVEVGEEEFEVNMDLVDALEELEDVDKVEHNMDN